MGELKLTNAQSIAYMMVNIIRKTLDYLLYKPTKLTNEEVRFVDNFYRHNLRDWRSVYLELTDYITKEKNKSLNLNEGISKILGCPISICFKNRDSNFIEQDIYLHQDDYILTGNDEILEMSHLIVTLIKMTTEKNIDCTDRKFKEIFCQEFMNYNGKYYTPEEVSKMFDIAIAWATREGLVYNTREGYYYDDNECRYDYLDPNRDERVIRKREPIHFEQYEKIVQRYLTKFGGKKLKLEK